MSVQTIINFILSYYIVGLVILLIGVIYRISDIKTRTDSIAKAGFIMMLMPLIVVIMIIPMVVIGVVVTLTLIAYPFLVLCGLDKKISDAAEKQRAKRGKELEDL